MAKGNDIIVSNNPRGRREEIIISGTPKPGTVMTVTTAALSNGRFTMEAYNRDADGNRAPIAVLLADELRGILQTTAYASGDRGFVYYPLPGDDLNMLVANIAGTGDAFTIGDYMIVDDGTGKLIATTGSPESEPFQIMETVAALTADTLLWCKFTGY